MADAYKTDLLDLRRMDCMELMRGVEDNAFDLAIVDPPYGVGADKKNSVRKLQSKGSAALSKDYGGNEWDDHIPRESYFRELIRTSAHQIIWGVNYYPYDFLSGGRLYWNKCVTMPTYSSGELAYCSKLNSIKSFKYAWHGMIQGDMKNKEHRIHPTQKPIALYNWLLHNYATPGDRILDTHLGSGSIAVACHYKGFHLTGTELDQDYFDGMVKRVSSQTAQTELDLDL